MPRPLLPAALLLAAALAPRGALAMCDASCFANCSAATKAACAADDTCGGVSYWHVYMPGSVTSSYGVQFARRGAPCASKPVPGGGVVQYSYLDPADNATWVDVPFAGWACRGADVLPSIAGWDGPCYTAATVGSCAVHARPAERLVSIWQPGFTPAQGAAMVQAVRAHPGVFNALSVTTAFWSSPFNSKCGTASWNGTGLCVLDLDNATAGVVAELASLGLAPVPIVETCCVCVLNATYDWRPAMGKLVADAVARGYAGYAVDIECGGAEFDVAARSVAFFDALGAQMRAVGKHVSYWTHYTQYPDDSFPNAMDYMYTMDSYEYAWAHMVDLWTTSFACQGGIGLEYPGGEDLATVQAMFADMAANQTVEAAGVWGFLPVENTTMNAAWWAGLKAFREGWVR